VHGDEPRGTGAAAAGGSRELAGADSPTATRSRRVSKQRAHGAREIRYTAAPMISPATRAMNASTHTLGDLKTFAQAEPAAAAGYLERVRENFIASGRQVPPPVNTAIAAIPTGPVDALSPRVPPNRGP